MPDVPTSAVVRALALGVVVVGTAGFMTAGKTVTLRVEDQTRDVRTYSRTVAEVLAEEGITVGVHDVVTPASTEPVGEGGRIEVRRGRFVMLTVDGVLRPVWTVATTVGELAATLGTPYVAAALSAPRAQPIPLAGMVLAVTLPKQVTLVHDGIRTTVVSAAPTVGGVLAEAGLQVGRPDITLPALDQPVTEGLRIRVVRVEKTRSSVRTRVAYRTVHIATASMYRGESTVRRAGRVGVRVTTYLVIRHDGEVVSRVKVTARVVRAPQERIVLQGTAQRPVTRARGSGVDALNWHALAICESSGNPRAVGGGGIYFGLYQFNLSTWHGVGGRGNPIDASPAEQTYRAKLLYRDRGSQPWPTCGRLLYT